MRDGRPGTHLGSQRHDLPPPLHAEVRTDHPTNTRAKHLALVVQEDRSVVVEADVTTVWPAYGLARTDDDSAADVALADLGSRGRRLS